MQRTVSLGGELKGRGIVGGRTRPETWILVGSVLAGGGVLFLGRSSLASLIFGGVIFAAGVLLTWPTPLLRGRSAVALWAERRYSKHRAKHGTNIFDPDVEAAAAARAELGREHSRAVVAARKAKQPAPTLPQELKSKPEPEVLAAMKRLRRRGSSAMGAPLFMGKAQLRQVPGPDGELVAVMRHELTKDPTYTVVFEVEGLNAGAVEADIAQMPFMAWGSGFLAQAARRDSPISHVQSFTRSVPADMVDHVHWLARYVDKNVALGPLSSYQELVLDSKGTGEQHRSFVVLRFDRSEARNRLMGYFSGQQDALEKGIAQEAHTLMSKGRMSRAFSRFRPVDGPRLMGLLAHLQNPYRFDIDEPGVTPDRVFSRLDGSVTDKAVVADSMAYTRVGYIPRDGFNNDPNMSVRTMNEFVSSIQPAVVHSVSWINKLEDARTARGKARRRRASSMSRKREREKSGRLSDGTDEVVLDADTQRAMDLAPGGGQHGAEWAAYISFTVPNEEDLYHVSSQIEAQAFDIGIERIEWLDGKQDLALAAVMPLGRGIR